MTAPNDIVQFVAANPGSSRGKIASYLGMTPVAATKALSRLVANGLVTMTGKKRGATYSVTGRTRGETYTETTGDGNA